jgi:hypothetical protein
MCNACMKEHGYKQADRPEWLKYLVREEAKERMRLYRGYYDREISLEEVDNDEFWYVEYWDEDRFPK